MERPNLLFDSQLYLSLLRLALVPVLVGLAYLPQRGEAFLGVLAVSLLSDVLDGYLARKLGQASELGAKLDSWGDMLTYGGHDSGPASGSGRRYFPPKQAAFVLAASDCRLSLPIGAGSVASLARTRATTPGGPRPAAVLMAPAYYALVLTGLPTASFDW